MKRFHVHIAVDDLKQSIGFYSELFGTEPSAIKTDYAKWMLEDPRVNFAISTRGRQAGLDHLGIQADNGDELKEIYSRLHRAGGNITKPKKSWIVGPIRYLVGNIPYDGRKHGLRRRQRRAGRPSRT